MNFKISSILALMALVFVFTTTANPAEEHVIRIQVTEMVHKPAEHHASEDHHHAAVKVDHAAHTHDRARDDVKKVKKGMKFMPRHAREAKGTPAPKAVPTKRKYLLIGVPKAH